MGESELRDKVATQAKRWLGYKESDGSHKEILAIYNEHSPLAMGYTVKATDSWCATYVSACAIATGLADIIPTECSCGRQIQLFQDLGRWEESDGYVPQVGDVIYYDWDDGGSGDNTGWPEHVGLVTKLNDTTITVIEGNIKNAVGYRTLQVGGKYIRGYGLPDYASKAVTEPVAEESSPTEVQLRALIREELASMLQALSQQPVSDWAVAELAEAVTAGITDGTRPQAYVTRQEAALMAYRASKVGG